MYRQHLTTVARARNLCTAMVALWVWGFAGICSKTGRAAWEGIWEALTAKLATHGTETQQGSVITQMKVQ